MAIEDKDQHYNILNKVVIGRIAHFQEKQAISTRRNFWVQLNGQFCLMQTCVVHVFVDVATKLSLYAKLPLATK